MSAKLRRVVVSTLLLAQFTLLLAAAVHQHADIRVAEPCDGARLAPEPFDVLGVVGVAVVQDLDGDPAAQPAVAGAVDEGHPSGAGQLLELVAPRNQLADHGL